MKTRKILTKIYIIATFLNFFAVLFNNIANFADAKTLIISEINPAGSVKENGCKTGLVEGRCAFDKWVEITNVSGESINSAGYILSFKGSDGVLNNLNLNLGQISSGQSKIIAYNEVNFVSVLSEAGVFPSQYSGKIRNLSSRETGFASVRLLKNNLVVDEANFNFDMSPDRAFSYERVGNTWVKSSQQFFVNNFGTPGFVPSSLVNFFQEKSVVQIAPMPVLENTQPKIIQNIPVKTPEAVVAVEEKQKENVKITENLPVTEKLTVSESIKVENLKQIDEKIIQKTEKPVILPQKVDLSENNSQQHLAKIKNSLEFHQAPKIKKQIQPEVTVLEKQINLSKKPQIPLLVDQKKPVSSVQNQVVLDQNFTLPQKFFIDTKNLTLPEKVSFNLATMNINLVFFTIVYIGVRIYKPKFISKTYTFATH